LAHSRLVEDLDCVEHGYLLLPVAEQHLDPLKDTAAAHEAVESGTKLGTVVVRCGAT
jgi:hypothetical protein